MYLRSRCLSLFAFHWTHFLLQSHIFVALWCNKADKNPILCGHNNAYTWALCAHCESIYQGLEYWSVTKQISLSCSLLFLSPSRSLSLFAQCGTRSVLSKNIPRAWILQCHQTNLSLSFLLSTMITLWKHIPTVRILLCPDETLKQYVGGARRGSWKICLLSLKHTWTSQGFILFELRCKLLQFWTVYA